VEIRDVGPRYSLTEDLEEIDTQNNSESESENESISEESDLDKTEQTDDSDTNNIIIHIIKIHDSLFARTDSIVIFLAQDGEPCDYGSYLLAKDNNSPRNKKRDPRKGESNKTGM